MPWPLLNLYKKIDSDLIQRELHDFNREGTA